MRFGLHTFLAPGSPGPCETPSSVVGVACSIPFFAMTFPNFFSWIAQQFSEDVRGQLPQKLDIVSNVSLLYWLNHAFGNIVSKCIFSQSIIMIPMMIF